MANGVCLPMLASAFVMCCIYNVSTTVYRFCNILVLQKNISSDIENGKLYGKVSVIWHIALTTIMLAPTNSKWIHDRVYNAILDTVLQNQTEFKRSPCCATITLSNQLIQRNLLRTLCQWRPPQTPTFISHNPLTTAWRTNVKWKWQRNHSTTQILVMHGNKRQATSAILQWKT